MGVEVYINGVSVPFIGETGIGINKKLNEAELPENFATRSANNTYTIQIPGSTEGVRELFNNIYDCNIDQSDYLDFTPTRVNTRISAPAQVYQDSILVFEGIAKLIGVTTQNGNQIIFNVQIFSQLANLFTNVGEKFVNELDLSRFDHPYTIDNIANSWATSIVQSGSPVAFELGKGYVYPMIDYGGNNGAAPKPTNWGWNDFRPSVYLKTIVDQIFSEAGIRYQSNFFNSTEYKQLIVPYSNGAFNISEQLVTDYSYQASRITSVDLRPVDSSFNGTQAIVFNNDISDPSNQFDTTTGIFTSAFGGRYNFNLRWTGRLKYLGAPVNAPGGVIYVYLELVKVSTTGAHQTFASKPAIFQFINPVTSGNYSITSPTVNIAQSVNLLPGEQVYCHAVLSFVQAGTISAAVLEIETAVGSTFNALRDASLNYGEIIPISQCLPDDFKQKDLLASVIKMFNLQFEDSEDYANTIIIEPRPQYYVNNSIDLSELKDIESPTELVPQGLSKYRSYEFTYIEDEDYFNEDYTTRTGEIYGELKIRIANDFLGDEYKTEIAFAPTILKQEAGTNRVTSAIYFVDSNGNKVEKAAKPRVLIYGGLISTTQWTLNGVGTSANYTSYPFAGHVDTPYNPTQDLCFLVPKFFYYGGQGALQVTITNQNLYNQYYYQHIEEIAGEQAFTARASFNINPDLFFRYKMRNLYFFNECYWRTLEVVDYSVSPPKLTEIYFLKALGITAPPPITQVVNGGTGTWEPIPGNDYPTPGLIAPPPDNTRGVFGVGNNISPTARNVLAVGTGITIGDEADNVVVLGGNQPAINGGTVGGLYFNVDFTDTQFLSDNLQASGFTAISGETVFIGGTINVSGDAMFHNPVAYRVGLITDADSPHDIITPRLICVNNSADIDVYLPTPTNLNGRNSEYVITKRNAAHQVNLYAQGGAFIYHNTGVDNPYPLTGRQSITIIWDGVGGWQVITGP